jgi:AcrR family transcriptional regulator
MASSTRRERERERHRREVLLAAESVFAEKGYGATMHEIAERAEFAVGSLYNLFESKEALFQELMELRFEDFADQVEAAVADRDNPAGKVRALIEAKLSFFRENQPLFRILRSTHLSADAGPAHRPTPEIIEIYVAYLQRVEGILAEGIRHGAFREADPYVMALCVDGMTSALIEEYILIGRASIDEASSAQIERLLFSGILARKAD